LEGLKQENEHLKFVVEQLEFEKQLSPKADEEKLSGARDDLFMHDTINNELLEIGTLKGAEAYCLECYTEGKTTHPDFWGFDLFVKVGRVDSNCKASLSESPAEKEEDLESSSSNPDCNSVVTPHSSSSNSIEQ
jgi:hypothetical protein